MGSLKWSNTQPGTMWKTSIQAVRTWPGTDRGSDYELLMAEVKLKVKSKKNDKVTH